MFKCFALFSKRLLLLLMLLLPPCRECGITMEEYMKRVVEEAYQNKAGLVVFTMDTRGLVTSMRQ